MEFEHGHTIKHPLISRLYDDCCRGCLNGRTLNLPIYPLLTRSQPPKVDQSWFGNKPSLVVYQEWEKFDKVQEHHNALLLARSAWLPYNGMWVVGEVAPIEYDFIIGDVRVIKTTRGFATVGDRSGLCEQFSRLSLRELMAYRDALPLIKYLESMKDRLDSLRELDVEKKYDVVMNDLEKVIVRTMSYVMRLKQLEGYELVRIDHIHSSSIYDLRFIPCVVRQIGECRIYRAVDGYVFYNRIGAPLDIKSCQRFMDNHPFNHARWVNFDVTACTPDEGAVIAEIRVNPDLLSEELTYQRLLGYIQTLDYQTNKYYVALNYLRLCHYQLYRERANCKAFIFSGPPGVGKSYEMSQVTGSKDNVYHYSYDHKTKQYFDGYYGQSVMTIDDIGHYSSDEWKILLKLVTDVPYKLPMAFGMKDRVPSLLEEVYLTTNHLGTLLKLPRVYRDAICRRAEVFEFMGDTIVHKLYSMETGTYVNIHVFTKESFRSYFSDFVKSQRQELRLEKNEGVHLLWKGIELMKDFCEVFFPERKALQKLRLNITKAGVIVAELQQMVSLMVGVKRAIDVAKVMRIFAKAIWTRSDIRYLEYEKKHADLTKLPQHVKDLFSEGYEASVVGMMHGAPVARKCMGLDITPLMDDIKSFSSKVEVKSLNPTDALEFARTIGVDLSIREPVAERIFIKLPVNERLSPLYDCGRWVMGRIYPSAPHLFSLKNESEYRPTTHFTKVYHRAQVHRVLQGILSNTSESVKKRTVKRREERKRAKARLGGQ